MPGETVGDDRVYTKPEVPVLMWDGECYELGAGEVKQFPRFLAEHFANKIVDRYIIDQTKEGIEGKLNKANYAVLLKKVFMETTPVKAVVAPIQDVEEETEEETTEVQGVGSIATNEMAMGQLRQLAKQKGLKYPLTTSKNTLVQLINDAAGAEITD
jgi:hypothetical protein